MLARKAPYFNPDLAARALLESHPGMDQQSANAHAWAMGRDGLARALGAGLNFAFETTLGANTLTDMLLAGAGGGARVHVWYAGLSSPELHIQRVKERVVAGGHDIPEHKIHERYVNSRANLVRLLPHLASLRVLDNSAEADPKNGLRPCPVLLLHMAAGRIVSLCLPGRVPQWAKPIVAAAMDDHAGSASRKA